MHVLIVCLLMLASLTLSKAQPVLLRDDMKLEPVLKVGFGNVRLRHNPADNQLYLLNPDKGVMVLDLERGFSLNVADLDELGAQPMGMTFDADGNLYVVTNVTVDEYFNQATILKGFPTDYGGFDWMTVASTEPYPLSNTIFNHNYNGIVLSPDGQWLFVNAGSRTDHGEIQDFEGLFPGLREAALTSKILRIPADAENLVLPNDEAALLAGDYIYAWGLRNAFDLAFAANGELFAVDNGPDADYPDELNWIRQGHHYGFPWQFGDWDNPRQFADYDSRQDRLLHPDFTAVREGYYGNDPDFPPPPTDFSLPVANLGPGAAIYRALTGSERNAATEGERLYTFTPHISPLGLVFVTSEEMPEDLRTTNESLSAFVLSWGAAGGTLSDRGQNLLHLRLRKVEGNYEVFTTEIASNFRNPVDAVLAGDALYILEWGDEGSIWKLSFELGQTQ